MEHGDAGAVNEIGVAEGERGRVQVRLVVARDLNRLPLALLDLKAGRCEVLVLSKVAWMYFPRKMVIKGHNHRSSTW